MFCENKESGLKNLQTNFGIYDSSVHVEDSAEFSYFIKFEKKPRRHPEHNYEIRNESTQMMLNYYNAQKERERKRDEFIE